MKQTLTVAALEACSLSQRKTLKPQSECVCMFDLCLRSYLGLHFPLLAFMQISLINHDRVWSCLFVCLLLSTKEDLGLHSRKNADLLALGQGNSLLQKANLSSGECGQHPGMAPTLSDVTHCNYQNHPSPGMAGRQHLGSGEGKPT